MLRSVFRLTRIIFTVLRFRLDALIPFDKLPWYLRYTVGMLCQIGRQRVIKNRGERLRLALESLGPIFVKFGQILSTRRDLLDDDIADELAKLQDKVPAFSGKTAQAIRLTHPNGGTEVVSGPVKALILRLRVVIMTDCHMPFTTMSGCVAVFLKQFS